MQEARRLTQLKPTAFSGAKTGLLFFALVMLLPSCDVQMRRYTKGYYTHRKSGPQETGETARADSSAAPPVPTQTVSTTTQPARTVINISRCDTLVFAGNMPVAVKITDVGYKKISYRFFDAQNPQERTVKRSQLDKIIYRDGSYECVKPCITADTNPLVKEEPPVISSDSCMLIVRRNGKRIRGRVVKTEADAIYYVSCDKEQKTPIRLETTFISRIVPVGSNHDVMPRIERKSYQSKTGAKTPWPILIILFWLIIITIPLLILLLLI